ncbi:serine hydrolase, partial [bacterium]|nr:serine hydrolase [bacterium]
MKILTSTFILILLFTAAYCYDFSLLDSLFTQNLAYYDSNLFVKIIQGDSTIYEYSHGLSEDSIWGLASATKWISGGVILALADAGFLDLDDTLGEFLPIFTANGKGHITIRQCFSMSSGLFGDRNYQWDPYMTLAEAAESIAVHTPLEFTPGTMIGYDGKGMQAAGRAAEIATGRDWREIAQEYLLDKCDMTHCSYDYFGPLNPAVAGGLKCSPRDYLRFLKMIHQNGIYGGETVLSEESIEVIFSNITEGLPIYYSPWPSGPHYPYGRTDPEYAFGSWVIAQHPITRVVEELSSPGAFGTCPFIDRSRNLYGVIFTKLTAGGFGLTGLIDLEALEILRFVIDNSNPDNRVITVSPYGKNYLDFEILSSENLMNFVGEGNIAWLAELNPYTGEFMYPEGRQTLIDTITPLIFSNNGPEFAIDAEGWSLIYTAIADSNSQVWMAVPDGDSLINTQLTFTGHNHYSALVSQNPLMLSVNVAFIKHSMAYGNIWWFSESDPANERFVCEFERGSTPFRWMPNSPNALFLLETTPGLWQLAIFDNEGDSTYIITNDPGNKTDPTAFLAPEFSYELIISAVSAQETLIVYRDLGGDFWTPISKLTIPPESEYDVIQSPEFFEYNGQSFHSLHIEEGDGSVGIPPGEVWVFGIDDDPAELLQLRCDNGLPDIHRTDPEPYVGAEDVFVYYTVLLDSVNWEIRRCKTGMCEFLGTEAEHKSIISKEFEISAYPNPFNCSTVITVEFIGSAYAQLHHEDLIGIKIYDINGRIVYESPLSPGVGTYPLDEGGDRTGEIVWEPETHLSSGVYLIRASLNSEYIF